MDIELKSYEDIAVLAQETAANASGFGGRSLGLPGVQLPTEQQRDMRRAVRQPALPFARHASQRRQQISDCTLRLSATTQISWAADKRLHPAHSESVGCGWDAVLRGRVAYG